MFGPFALALGFVAGSELHTAFVRRRRNRRQLFAEAQARARATGAPLLVVGDPDTGYVTKHYGRDYGCGTVCTDLTGCPSCPTGLRGRLEDVLPRLSAQSYVVFVSCTLEYVQDLPHCVRELERVAVPGGLFVVPVETPHSTFVLYPGANWVLLSAPPRGPWRYRRYGSR